MAFYRNIVEGTKDGSLYKNGYALWPAKNFKITTKFIDGLRKFDFLRAMACLPKDTYILLGNHDVLVDKSYAENYAKEFGFEVQCLDANHAFTDNMNEAKRLTVE